LLGSEENYLCGCTSRALKCDIVKMGIETVHRKQWLESWKSLLSWTWI